MSRSNERIRKLGEIKQYQSKLPKNVVLKLSKDIYGILGGIHAILEHYVANARFLNAQQINQLHELLQSNKQKFSKRQLQKRRKRANSSINGGSASLLSQSFTPLCSTKSHGCDESPRPRVSPEHTNMRPKTPKTRPKTPKAAKTPKTSTSKARRTRTATNYKQREKQSSSITPQQQPQQQQQQRKINVYKPLFASKTTQNAQMRQNKRDHKRRGSGLEERLKLERGLKVLNKNMKQQSMPTKTWPSNHHISASGSKTPKTDRFKQTVRHNYTQNKKRPHLRHDTQQTVIEHNVQQTMIEHNMDTMNDMYEDVDDLSEMSDIDGVGAENEMITEKTMYDKDDLNRLKYDDKERRYSISEHTDWCTDDDEKEIVESNEYFKHLQKKYAKKSKGKKKNKRKKAKTRKKMMKLKRMAMEQMRTDKTKGKHKDEESEKEQKDNVMSAMDALHNVLNDEDTESDKENMENNQVMVNDGYTSDDHEEGQQTQKTIPNNENEGNGYISNHNAYTSDNHKHNNNNNNSHMAGIESPEFLAYFDNFMQKNCSFYVSQMENINDMDDSEVSSMEYDDLEEQQERDDVYQQNISF